MDVWIDPRFSIQSPQSMSSSPTQLRRRFKQSSSSTSLNSGSSSSSSLSSASSDSDTKTVQAQQRQRNGDSGDKFAKSTEASTTNRSPVIYTSAGFICAIALLFRFLVALHPYSGHATPPKYGDFEAQRHWMEITVNTPINEWYRQSEVNDLTWWGLDYPPLSAYWAFITGKV